MTVKNEEKMINIDIYKWQDQAKTRNREDLKEKFLEDTKTSG